MGGQAAGQQNRRSLAVALGLVAVYLVVQIVAGLLTGSLALLSDAGHMASDVLGIGMALAASTAASQAEVKGSRTYGLYRVEILAALANAVLVFVVGAYVIYEAVRRWQEPTEVSAGPVLVVGLVGLLINLIVWRMLRSGADDSLNMEGASLEALADLIGSIGVIVAAMIVWLTGWNQADSLIAALIGVFILPRAWRLGKRALRVILQFTPEGLDIDELRTRLGELDQVLDVHDLHVWTLTSAMDVASVHLVTTIEADAHRVLDDARTLPATHFGIGHATLQVEPNTHEGCTELAY